MADVLSSNDPFYMTFGKDDWNNAQTQKAKRQPKQSTQKKKVKKIFDHQIITDRPRRSSQTHKKKPIASQNLNKQNIDLNIQTAGKSKPQSSITDRYPKKLMDFVTIRQELPKKYSNDKPSKPTHKYGNIFDVELNKRLKEIETATKVKIQKIRTISENRKIDSIHENEKMYDKCKPVNVQMTKKIKLTTVNPTINRYREEMQKLDSLIHRINVRINTSNPKIATDLVKLYTFDKA